MVILTMILVQVLCVSSIAKKLYWNMAWEAIFATAVDTGVNEGEPVEEFAEQYHEPEPEDPYREQELPEGFEDGKFNLILWLHILT